MRELEAYAISLDDAVHSRVVVADLLPENLHRGRVEWIRLHLEHRHRWHCAHKECSVIIMLMSGDIATLRAGGDVKWAGTNRYSWAHKWGMFI